MRTFLTVATALLLLTSCEPNANETNNNDSENLVAQSAPTQDDGAGNKSKKDLEKDGYKCEVVSFDSIECTKTGSPTYICDNGGKQCREKPYSNPSDGAVNDSVVSGDDLGTNENEM